MSDAAVERRVLAELGEVEGGKIVAFAHALMARPAAPARTEKPPVEVVVTKSDAAKAGGTTSEVVNAKIIREACAGQDEAAARETVELLKQLEPANAREALMIRRLVALDSLMVETVALARTAHHPLLRDAYVAQACALSRAATSLDEAIERRRVGKPEQRVVVQHIRGGQVVGMVNQDPPGR
jgi:hypothetical protein